MNALLLTKEHKCGHALHLMHCIRKLHE